MKQQPLGLEGNIFGRCDDTHMLNYMIFKVEFPDVQMKYYAENFIAKNMVSQVNDKGYSFNLVNPIVDYKRDD